MNEIAIYGIFARYDDCECSYSDVLCRNRNGMLAFGDEQLAIDYLNKNKDDIIAYTDLSKFDELYVQPINLLT